MSYQPIETNKNRLILVKETLFSGQSFMWDESDHECGIYSSVIDGEDARAVVLSVTEGEDKPLKYPLMFRVADVAILNKIDLLPYLDFDAQLVVENMRQVHPHLPIFETSAKTGEGFEVWIEWLKVKVFEKTGK